MKLLEPFLFISEIQKKSNDFFLFGQKVKRTVSENQGKKLSATESIKNDWCRLLNN